MKQSPLVTQGRVIGALMLRDVKARFGGKGANYLIAIGWPLAHIVILLLIYTLAGRAAPIGNSAALFFATGLLPFMSFNYPSRQMMLSLIMNGPLLNFPVVNVVDVLLARAALEVITSFAVAALLAFILYACGVNIVPRHPTVAVSALLATLLLAIGFGFLNSIIQQFVKVWIYVYILILILLYLTSGILFVLESLPEKAQAFLVWLPTVHIVEWFRSAYFDGYGRLTLDKSYVVAFGVVTLALSLAFERMARRWFQF